MWCRRCGHRDYARNADTVVDVTPVVAQLMQASGMWAPETNYVRGGADGYFGPSRMPVRVRRTTAQRSPKGEQRTHTT